MLPNGSSDILYMYVQFLSLESGVYRCVFTLRDVLLRLWASIPKIKSPLIPLNLNIVFVRNKCNSLLSLNSFSIHLSCYAFLSNLSVRSSKLAALFGCFRRP